MLQQTQVKTVIPYWERWMRELPSIRALAKARPQKVLKLWEGLGYYTRARNLHKAARVVMEQHGGCFPPAFDEVLALPGIGRYTAGAICSIAYNRPAPIVDGNIIRVLTRLFGIRENPRERKTQDRLWELAGSLVESASQLPATRDGNCSHLNQSMMELGALICTPRAPKCNVCPVRRVCVARAERCAEELPNLGVRQRQTDRHFIALVLQDENRFLVQQRPANVVNAHLWEFPNLEMAKPTRDSTTFTARQIGFTIKSPELLCTIKHSITRYRITVQAFRANWSRTPKRKLPRSHWLTLAQMHKLPFTSAHKKILGHLTDG